MATMLVLLKTNLVNRWDRATQSCTQCATKDVYLAYSSYSKMVEYQSIQRRVSTNSNWKTSLTFRAESFPGWKGKLVPTIRN